MKVTVIGGGPGGYVAALKAAILGAETVLVEKDKVGGTCLNKGCIPTKSFLQSISYLDHVSKAGGFGVICEKAHVDYSAVLGRKNQVVNQLVGGVEFLLRKRGVRVVRGIGKLTGENVVTVTAADGSAESIVSDAVILATGSSPVVHDAFRYDGINVITSDEAMHLERIPKSMIIIGGGVIGCEFGQFYRKMGCDVTIVELAERILPMEDADASVLLSKSLKRDGIRILTGIKVEEMSAENGRISVTLSDGDVLEAEKMLVSIGRRAMTKGIGAEELDIVMKNGKILVNEKMETSMKGCYAIGDIVNSPALAHVASREAVVAVENIMGRDSAMTYHAISRCVYTSPEIACVGMTEDQVKEKGIRYKIGRFSMAGLGKAMVMGEVNGFVKVIADEDGSLIGAVMAGPHVTDMISELATAVELGLHARQLGTVIHPHPTIAEAIMEAVHDIEGEAVHSF